MNNILKISRMYLTNIHVRIHMEQAVAQTDFQLVTKFPIFQAIGKFIVVISIPRFLHQSCARCIHFTLFSLISVHPRLKLFSHLSQYTCITNGLFIQLLPSKPFIYRFSIIYVPIASSSYIIFVFISQKIFVEDDESTCSSFYYF